MTCTRPHHSRSTPRFDRAIAGAPGLRGGGADGCRVRPSTARVIDSIAATACPGPRCNTRCDSLEVSFAGSRNGCLFLSLTCGNRPSGASPPRCSWAESSLGPNENRVPPGKKCTHGLSSDQANHLICEGRGPAVCAWAARKSLRRCRSGCLLCIHREAEGPIQLQLVDAMRVLWFASFGLERQARIRHRYTTCISRDTAGGVWRRQGCYLVCPP